MSVRPVKASNDVFSNVRSGFEEKIIDGDGVEAGLLIMPIH